ncbi:carboxylic acid reductase [Nocardia arthritidis]|uniref:AMP-binding protein n=1 Tax=Nocardia arthritidis TaxID=228602 RepID=A0A6G9YM63_9NOCA|nr:carboxylic acid reductase [Nocardia arthritidis]QIS14013.1 AMP-binding protein [Nocardia arthritidis]
MYDSAAFAKARKQKIATLFAEDPQFASATPKAEAFLAAQQPGIPLAECQRIIFDTYRDRPAFAERAKVFTTDAGGRTILALEPRFDTLSYAEVWKAVEAVAAELYSHPRHPVRAGDFVSTIGFTSAQHATLFLALNYLGLVAVPLQTSATPTDLSKITDETEPKILAVSPARLTYAVELAEVTRSIKRIVVFDYHHEVDEHRELFESATQRLRAIRPDTTIDSLAEVIARGKTLAPAPLDTDTTGDAPSLLIYTSGSTGAPKGAVHTKRLVRDAWTGRWQPDHETPVFSMNFTPLSHLLGVATLAAGLVRGGISYFTAKSDLSTLFEDTALARPTELFLVPRICEMLFQHYQSERSRVANPTAETDEDIRAHIRNNVLGGRMVSLVCGSAPLSRELHEFMESCLQLHLTISLGSTEAGSILVDNSVQRPPVVEYKLVDVPELGYFVTDQPHPRGELLVKTETIIPGYYKRPEIWENAITSDGFYRTGDVMAEIAPDELVFVDRRNNVLKLSQGEFVTVSKLDALFVKSPLVRQVYVYGNGERSFLLAVVVPTAEALAGTPKPSELKARIAASIQQVANEAGLESYEIPRDFIVETDPFSTENGLLTDSRKLNRPKLKARFGDQLEALYGEMADNQASQLAFLRTHGADQSALQTVRQAAEAVLGTTLDAAIQRIPFTDLGGDSLSALTFANLLSEIFGIELPVAVILNPANDLEQIATHIESELAHGSTRPTFTKIHGAEATEVRARDITLAKFIDAATIAAAKKLPPVSHDPARVVLLTGANGYLGRLMLLELLERVAPRQGKVITIIRGSDRAAAQQRLERVFDTGDPEQLARFRELATDHLEVLVGDVGEPNLGLSEDTFADLARRVDLIHHVAAFVNHVMPYKELFGPNVLGTAEIVRLAITGRMKPVSFVSTVGVGADSEIPIDEEVDLRTVNPVRSLTSGYASGYAVSKWASEVLLLEAHDEVGLPVSVFRSDMILAHSRYQGQLNVPDNLTRLLFSLIATGIAPGSFYQLNYTGVRPRAHYSGLPGDFTAEAIATIGEENHSGHHTYNCRNAHDDGISLDTFVDWLVDAGCSIRRIDSYRDWFARFETALNALPEKQRQQSIQPLLHAYEQPPTSFGADMTADRFRDAVRAAKIGPDGDLPHLGAELIGKYVSDLRHLKMI